MPARPSLLRCIRRRGAIHALACSVALGLAVSACSDWMSTMVGNPDTAGINLSRIKSRTSQFQGGGNFTQSLAREYAAYADQLYKERDYVDSDYFSRKGIQAANGDQVPPENQARWAIAQQAPLGTRTELANARQRLLTVLDGGARQQSPAVAARAQERFDCWVQETERDWENIKAGRCRNEFYAALAELEPKTATPAPPISFQVLFETGHSDITPEGRQVVADAVTALKARPGAHVTIIGKTDTVGTPAFNEHLSERRAQAVKDTFVAAGVPADAITLRWTGEEQLNVPTANDVSEQRNRAVDIVIQ